MDWQNGFESHLTASTTLADTYIQMLPVPSTSSGRLVLEDTSSTNYEIIKWNRKDATGVYVETANGGVRNQDGNSTGVHAKGVRVRMNITAQDLKEIRDYAAGLLDDADTIVQAFLNLNGAAVSMRLIPRVLSQATISTLTPNIDTKQQYVLTAQASALLIDNPTGTPNDGDTMLIFLKDNGTTKAVTYGTKYVNITGLDRIDNTVAGKWHTIGFRYNLALDKWHMVSIATEA